MDRKGYLSKPGVSEYYMAAVRTLVKPITLHGLVPIGPHTNRLSDLGSALEMQNHRAISGKTRRVKKGKENGGKFPPAMCASGWPGTNRQAGRHPRLPPIHPKSTLQFQYSASWTDLCSELFFLLASASPSTLPAPASSSLDSPH